MLIHFEMHVISNRFLSGFCTLMLEHCSIGDVKYSYFSHSPGPVHVALRVNKEFKIPWYTVLTDDKHVIETSFII